MAIYLQYDGIKGNVTADGYKDHIAILFAKFDINRSIAMVPGNMTNRESTRPKLSAVTLTKVADNSVTGLFKESVSGSAGKKAEIKFVQTGKDKVPLLIEMSNPNDRENSQNGFYLVIPRE